MKKLLRSFTVVTALSVLTRLLSMICKIILSRHLSSYELGIYQSGLSVFAITLTIISSGFPLAVSRAFATNSRGERALFSAATVCFSISLFIFLFVSFSNGLLTHLFEDEKSFVALKLLIPALIVSSLYCQLRGALWGQERFFAFSFAEFFEEIIYIISVIALIVAKPDLSVYIPCIAITISSAFSCIYAFIAYFSGGGKVLLPKKSDYSFVASVAFPIISVRILASLTSAIMTLVLPKRIMLSGKTLEEALSLIGLYSGVINPLLFAPSAIIGSLCLVLLPKLAKKGKENKTTSLYAFTFAACLSALIVSLFLSLSKELTYGIFKKENAESILDLSCIAILPMSLNQVAGSILNSLGLEKDTLKSFIAGATISILIAIFLSPVISIYAQCLAVILQSTVSATMNIIKITKKLEIKPHELLRSISPFLLSIPLIIISFCVKRSLKTTQDMISILIVGIVTFAVFILFLLPTLPKCLKKVLTKD